MEVIQNKRCPICEGVGEYEKTLNATTLLKCTYCSFVYATLDEGSILRTNSGFDENEVRIYELRQSLLDDVWFQKIAKRFTSPKKTKKVLDIGCGNGLLLSKFMEHGWEVEGLDISPWAKGFANKYGFKLHEELVEETGIKKAEFDLITSTSVLEHISDPKRHIRAVMEKLKKDGIAFFCGIPNYGSLAVKLGLASFESNVPPRHVSFFTKKV